MIFSGCVLRKKNIEIPQKNINETSKVNNEDDNQLSPEIDKRYYDPRGNFYNSKENLYILRTPDIEELLSLQDIEKLSIDTSYNSIVDFTFLENLHNLKVLSIYGNIIKRNKNISLDFIKNVRNLETLWLDVGSIIIDGSFFSHLANLNSLQLGGYGIINMEEIFELPNLNYLWLYFYYDKIIIENVSLNSKLEVLGIFAAEIDLGYIGNLQRLKSLRLHSPKISNFSKINNPELESLYLESFSSKEFHDELNIEGLQNLNLLKTLSIIHFGIYDVRPLINLSHLDNIRFMYNKIDVMPLIENQNIKKITLDTWNYNEINVELFEQHGINIIKTEFY